MILYPRQTEQQLWDTDCSQLDFGDILILYPKQLEKQL